MDIPDQKPSLTASIEQIARLIRNHIKTPIPNVKKRKAALISGNATHTIEQIARLLRLQASKVQKYKEKKWPYQAKRKKSRRKS